MPYGDRAERRRLPGAIECIAERGHGSRFWFTPCPAVVRNAEGRIIGGINLLMEITDRKHWRSMPTNSSRAIIGNDAQNA